MAMLPFLHKSERNRLQPGLFRKHQLAQYRLTTSPPSSGTGFRAPLGHSSKKRVDHSILSFIGSGARFLTF
jgi:hypothetical protein